MSCPKTKKIGIEYPTLALAKEACSLNNACSMVLDIDCDSDGYWTCNGTSMSSSQGSCTYQKGKLTY